MNRTEIPLFHEAAWRASCEAAAGIAGKNCALSHDLYVDLFSDEMDAQLMQLPQEQRPRALQIAQEWDYATYQERQATQDLNEEHGYCSHGIELGCCPGGCGSGPDD